MEFLLSRGVELEGGGGQLGPREGLEQGGQQNEQDCNGEMLFKTSLKVRNVLAAYRHDNLWNVFGTAR